MHRQAMGRGARPFLTAGRPAECSLFKKSWFLLRARRPLSASRGLSSCLPLCFCAVKGSTFFVLRVAPRRVSDSECFAIYIRSAERESVFIYAAILFRSFFPRSPRGRGLFCPRDRSPFPNHSVSVGISWEWPLCERDARSFAFSLLPVLLMLAVLSDP